MKSDLIPITCLYFKQTTADHPRAGKWVNLPEALHPSWLFYGSRAEFLQSIESGQSPSPAGHIAMIPAPWETVYTGSEPA